MKHNYFQDEKLKYEDIEIPDELLFIVRRTVAADRKKKAAVRRNRILKTAGSVAAVLFLCLTVGVNSSYAFAEAAVKIPVVKDVAQAVVVRSYKPEIKAVYVEYKKGVPQKENPEEEEQPPEETASAVSDNDVISESEIPEKPTEQQEEARQEGIDIWKAEMTLKKLKEVTELYTPDMEERYADEPEKLRTILIAELPEKEIALYGYHEDGKITGAALRVKDTYRYFDWNYMNDDKELPDLSCIDIDGDGEEEVVVFLYNGETRKKEISREDIAEPGADVAEKNATAETDNESDKTEDNNIEDAVSENGAEEESSVSGNDVEKPLKKPGQTVGEIWAVDLKEKNWSAAVLSVNDYESQILHRLRAKYDEIGGTVQLYLMEEPFGEPVKLSVEVPEGSIYEAINLAAKRDFVIENGLFLQFRMEVSFLREDGEKVSALLERELETEISLEDGSLVIGEIKER